MVMGFSNLFVVERQSKFPRVLERHNPPGIERHAFPRRRIPALPLRLAFHAEFSKAADQDVVTSLQRGLHDVKQSLSEVGSPFLRAAVSADEGLNDGSFGAGCHGSLLMEEMEFRL